MRAVMEFTLPMSLKKEGKWWIAHCLLLGVASQGSTRDKAVKNLVEALQLFLESCFERGTLERVLKKCGFKLGRHTIEKFEEDDTETVHVPLNLLAKQHAQNPFSFALLFNGAKLTLLSNLEITMLLYDIYYFGAGMDSNIPLPTPGPGIEYAACTNGESFCLRPVKIGETWEWVDLKT